VTAAIGTLKDKPRVLFLLSIGSGAAMASGRGTAADAMITAAGGANPITAYSGYKPLSPEVLALADPDLLLMTAETLEMLGGPAAVLALPGAAATRAGRDRRIVAFEALYMLGFGPRTAHALRDLAAALHPTASLPPLPRRPWSDRQ
jgi:iron complex transport system substrate-binding protein